MVRRVPTSIPGSTGVVYSMDREDRRVSVGAADRGIGHRELHRSEGRVRCGQRTELNERRITSNALSMSSTDLTW